MSQTEAAPSIAAKTTADYREAAKAHLWRHMADQSTSAALKVIAGGEGCYLIDTDGKRYLDGTSQLICVEVGYSFGEEFAEAAAAQYREIGFAANFRNANPRAIELATVLAELAPEGFNHVWFTPSGGEGVEACWKIARQYYTLKGERRWKAISRFNAYHGATMGALSLMGIPEMRTPFEPLVAGSRVVRNTSRLGRPADETEAEFVAFLLDDLETAVLAEDPSTVAMIIMEPVQNHGGSLVPPAGYLEGVRAICDKYGILLVADETVTAYGRMGAWFASERYNMHPDIITTAKGLSSSYASIGAVLVSDDVFAVFGEHGGFLAHASTFGGHPVQAAVALKNLEIIKRLDLVQHVLDNEGALGEMAASFTDLDIVKDVRGGGYMWSIELTTELPDGTPMGEADLERFYGDAVIGGALEERGVFLRLAADAGDPVLFIAPPLVATTVEFEVIRAALRDVLETVNLEYRAS